MAEPCDTDGWGLGPWGEVPYAAPLDFEPGGPIPAVAPFDVYCVGPCGPITVLDTFNEVTESYSPGQLTSTAPVGDDLRFHSGGAQDPTTVRLHIQKSTPSPWSFEVSFLFDSLPESFVNLAESHAYIGVSSSNAMSAGLFFSQQGLLYTGSVLHDLSGGIVPNHPLQFLPGSIGDVTDGTYFTVRMAVDEESETTYIYITETDQVPVTGHQLRYIMPSVPIETAAATPLNGTTVSVRGTALVPVILDLNAICLGAGLLIPNLPPIADAGQDFSALRCSIVRLDGTRSRDPEEVPVSYLWRLTDAPRGSREVLVGDDAITITPTPYTNKLYSAQLEDLHSLDAVVPGDVLQVSGLFLDIATIGTDGGGFFVTVTDFLIPSPIQNADFKVLRQRGLQGRTEAKPRFYMDVTGTYRFSLRVSDGQLLSLDSDVVVNSLESDIARGVIPDVGFIWSHIGSFWGLVEDREPVEEVWSAIAQITASELLALWQHDASKGLQGTTRLFQRKWLHYDLFAEEPLPDLSVVPSLCGGVVSEPIPIGGISVPGYLLELLSQAGTDSIFFTGATLTAGQMAAQISAKLGPKYRATAFVDGVDLRVRISSDFAFEVGERSMGGLFPSGARNVAIQGTGGAPVGLSAYRVGVSLAGTDVRDGDYLILGDQSHRILSIISDVSDTSPLQRVVLATAPQVNAPSTWRIARPVVSKYLDFYAMLASDGDLAKFEVESLLTGELYTLDVRVWGVTSAGTELLVDCTDLALYTADSSAFRVRFKSILRKRYVRVDPLVREVPFLQELIRNTDDSVVLRQNIDFFIETFRGYPCIRFETSDSPGLDVWEYGAPPHVLWAEVTYLDNRPTIEAQYGAPMAFTLDDLSKLPSNTDYLSVVRGLWFSSLNGPTMRNLRVGSQILLGLPFAEEAGVIDEIDDRFSPTQGRMLVKDSLPPNITRAYTYPRSLKLESNPRTGLPFVVGDSVEQFEPLVEGVEVVDYLNNPTWWAPYQQQGAIYEVEKFFRFLVRVDSAAFNLTTLLFVRSFIQRVKPTYTFPLFVVRRAMNDATFEVTDSLKIGVTLRLFDGLCNARGLGYIFDDPGPAGGGFMGQMDSGSPQLAAPVYPTPSAAVYWGYDHEIICPQDYVTGTFTMVLGAPTPAAYDGIYLFDSGLFTDTLLDEGTSGILSFTPAGTYLGLPVTSAGNYSVSSISVRFDAPFSIPYSVAVQFVIRVNGVDVSTVPFTIPAGSGYQGFVALPGTLNIVPGDIVRVRVAAAGPSDIHVEWATVSVTLGAVYNWSIDSTTPAGTYKVTRPM